jgi:signal transduction histidine kinase
LKPEANARLQRRLAEQLELITTLISRIRNLALDLRPSILDDLGLVPAIRWYLDRQVGIGSMYGILDCDRADYPLSGSVGTACFRVLQEAIANVLKHARAANIRVTLRLSEQRLSVTIADDGAGFDVARARRESLRGGSFGLLGMQERLELIGGSLEIKSQPGEGTIVVALLPLIINDNN